MALRRALAGLAAASLALGGIMLTTSGANALVGDANVTEPEILRPVDATEESAMYNSWHYDPSHPGRAAQGTNGLVVAGGTKLVIVEGNENNVHAAATPPAQTVTQTIAGLGINAPVGAADVFYQVPVFFGFGSVVADRWEFTTLRKNVTDASDNWISSRVLPSVPANTAVPLADIVADLGADARAIATGFMVDGPANVVVSSFSNESGLTAFMPVDGTCVPTAAAGGNVFDGDIRADETTYPGWHDGAGTGAFVSTEAGLEVTGRSQILYGLTDASGFMANCLPLVNNMSVDVVESSAPVWAQVPVFYYPNGDITNTADRLFTTLRSEASALGVQWTSSGNIYADAAKTVVLVPANTPVDYGTIMQAIGQHHVIGFGFFVDEGQTATVSSLSWNGVTTNFALPTDGGGAAGGSAEGVGDASGNAGGAADGSGNASGAAATGGGNGAKGLANTGSAGAELLPLAGGLMLAGALLLGAFSLRRRKA